MGDRKDVDGKLLYRLAASVHQPGNWFDQVRGDHTFLLGDLFRRLRRGPVLFCWGNFVLRLFLYTCMAAGAYLTIYLLSKPDYVDRLELYNVGIGFSCVFLLCIPYLVYISYYVSWPDLRTSLQTSEIVSASELYERIQTVRSGRPWLGWTIDCHHMITEDLGEGGTREVPETTWSGKEEFRCADVQDASDPPAFPFPDTPNTTVQIIHFWKIFRFADDSTAAAFNHMETNVREANHFRDNNVPYKHCSTSPGSKGLW
ncbi:uncharacterized protein LOC129591495 [Paramacrobiotus metropolitanus]|uniref:uncharacterized protein LOC129591495 n=1 Tax=Paramacrobiotus metropolitanus TaxID=2943436 RepID=UPI00244636E5|nr:uncharacterized protein LOC129591495 [Paramacrobiotus metropolitanus]